MSWMQAAVWGLVGGAAGSMASLMAAVHAAGFRWPWADEGRLGPRLFVFAGWMVLGAMVPAAAHAQMSGGWPAFIMGAGAPATVRGLLSGIEVHPRSLPPSPGPRSTRTKASESAQGDQ